MTSMASTQRAAANPIVIPTMVVPSRPDFQVVGVFNPGVLHVGDETVLLLRVAEAPRGIPADEVAAPVYEDASVASSFARGRETRPASA